MRERGWIAGLLLALAACSEAPPPATSYERDLQARAARVQPHVERAIGRKLGRVEIEVLRRDEVAAAVLPRTRRLLRRMENGARGEELEELAKATAEGSAHGLAAQVDERSRILFPDPAEEPAGIMALLGEMLQQHKEPDPRRLDLLLVHEMIHVHQNRHLEPASFYGSIRCRADLVARSAVVEGHAEYWTARIADRLGVADVHESWYRVPKTESRMVAFDARLTMAQTLYAYRHGRTFVEAVVKALGYDAAMKRLFHDPPSLGEVSRPEAYLRGERFPSKRGPLGEDLRRWLHREHGEASLKVVVLPAVRVMAGDAADAFREGFAIGAAGDPVQIRVLFTANASGAATLYRAWIRQLEHIQALRAEEGLSETQRIDVEPGHWRLHTIEHTFGHTLEIVRRKGEVIVETRVCGFWSEDGVERLAARALKFATDPGWRRAWLVGGDANSEDPDLRVAAALAGKQGPGDPDWDVRWHAYRRVAANEELDEGERQAALVAAMEDPHPEVVARGLALFSDLWITDVPWPRLHACLTHRNDVVRRAAWAIAPHELPHAHGDEGEGRISPAEAAALIARALDDPDPVVRGDAVEAFSEILDAPEVVPLVRRALRDESERVRAGMLITLSVYSYAATPAMIPELLACLDEEPAYVAQVLGHIGPEARETLPLLRKQKMTTEVATAIWRIDGDAAPLFKIVRESVANGAPKGLDTLAEMKDTARPVVPEVIQALDHKNPWTRAGAAEALGAIGGDRARGALTRRLGVEKNARVLESLRKALGNVR